MRKVWNDRVDLVLGDQHIEYLEERVNDGLAQGIGALGNFGVLFTACSKGKIAALVGDDCCSTFDCPLCEVRAVLDRGGFHRLSLFMLVPVWGRDIVTWISVLFPIGFNEPYFLCSIEEVLDRGWRPFRVTTGCPLMEAFELAGDLAKRQFGIGRVYARDKRRQAILEWPRRGFFQQARIGKVLANEPFHGATEPFGRPVHTALLQNAGDVIPGMVRTRSPNCWKPLVRVDLDALAIGRFLSRRHFGEHLRPAFSDTWIAG